MKKYEAVIILNPNLSSKVDTFTKDFEKLLSSNSFNVVKYEDVGRRQLAYSINNHNKGHYLLFNIEGDSEKLIEIENKIKYNESIIRHLFISVKEHLGEENFSKTASVEDSRTESEVRQELYELKGTLDFLDDNLRESVMTIEQSFDKLAFCTKQEVLDNTPFNNVKYVVEYAAPKAGVKIAQGLVEKYTEVMPHIDFEKEATYKGTPNVNSEIYKLAKHIENEAERACKINDAIVHYNDKHNDLAEKHELPKYARIGMIRTIGRGIINFVKKHPMLTGAAVGGTLAYGSGKKKGQEEQGEILKNYYEERRPSAHQPVFRRVR